MILRSGLALMLRHRAARLLSSLMLAAISGSLPGTPSANAFTVTFDTLKGVRPGIDRVVTTEFVNDEIALIGKRPDGALELFLNADDATGAPGLFAIWQWKASEPDRWSPRASLRQVMLLGESLILGTDGNGRALAVLLEPTGAEVLRR